MAGRLPTVRTGLDYAVATPALVLGQEVAMGSRLARLGVLTAVVVVVACGGQPDGTPESRPTEAAPPAALTC